MGKKSIQEQRNERISTKLAEKPIQEHFRILGTTENAEMFT